MKMFPLSIDLSVGLSVHYAFFDLENATSKTQEF